MVSEQKTSQVVDADAIDDDILDLLDVVEVGKGVPEDASGNAEADFAASLDSMLDDLESHESEDKPFPDPTPVDHEVDLNESLDLPSMDDLDNLLAELGAEAPETTERSHDLLADGDDLDSEGASSGVADNKASITAALDDALSSLDELDALDELDKPETPEAPDFSDGLDFDHGLDGFEPSASHGAMASSQVDEPGMSDSLDSSETTEPSDISDIADAFATFEAQNKVEEQDGDEAPTPDSLHSPVHSDDLDSDQAELLAEITGQGSLDGAAPVAPSPDASPDTSLGPSPDVSPQVLPDASAEVPSDDDDILSDVFDAAVAKMESEAALQQEDDTAMGVTQEQSDGDAFETLQAASLFEGSERDSDGAPGREDLPLDIEGLGAIEAEQDPFESALAASQIADLASEQASPEQAFVGQSSVGQSSVGQVPVEQEDVHAAEIAEEASTVPAFDVNEAAIHPEADGADRQQTDEVEDAQSGSQSSSTVVIGTRLDEDVNELDALLDEMLAPAPLVPLAEAQEAQSAGQVLSDDMHDIFERLDNLESSSSTQQLFDRCASLEEVVAQKDEAITSLEQSLNAQIERVAQLETVLEEQKASLASFTADMDKMVAAAAAKVIREEIAALIQSLQGEEA